MGYTTWFTGSFVFDKPVDEKLKNYINDFADTRHMQRDPEKIKVLFPNWKDKCFNGELGKEGEYFVGGDGFMDQRHDKSIIEFNYPPATQPGLWCQWIINDSDELEWDGGEKFYNYVEWLQYLIDNFFAPLSYTLNGSVEFQGEDEDDLGTIHVENNKVTVEYGIHVTSMSGINTNDLIAELENRGYIVIK